MLLTDAPLTLQFDQVMPEQRQQQQFSRHSSSDAHGEEVLRINPHGGFFCLLSKKQECCQLLSGACLFRKTTQN